MEWELVLKFLSYFKSLETYKAHNEFEARVASFRSEFFGTHQLVVYIVHVFCDRNTPGSGLYSARILWHEYTS